MKRQQNRRGQPCFLDSPQSGKGGLLKAGTFSLLLHIALLVIFSLSLKSTIAKMGPSVYRVTLRPLLGDGLPKGGSGLPGSAGLSASPVERLKPIEKPGTDESKKGKVPTTKKQETPGRLARNEMVEGMKRSPKKGEKLEKEIGLSKSFQEALEEIRKKAALDKIQKRVARREELEKGQMEEQSTTSPSQGPIVSSPRDLPGSGSGVGTGTGSGTGTGYGTGTGTGGSPTGSPWGSPFGGSSALQSKLDEYYSTIWERIKKEWTLPGDLPKGKATLETIIIIVVERGGKIQKSWFEKKSGNPLYDQMAMRAIKKSDPLPPLPKEFSDNTFEVGIRFHPE
jgi:TonB family protein